MAQGISGKSLLVSHLLPSHWPKQAQSLNDKAGGKPHCRGVDSGEERAHVCDTPQD